MTSMFLLVQVMHFLLLPYFPSVAPVASVFQSSAVVGALLNPTTACQEINLIF